MKPYLTIKESGNYTQIIKKSRFITHLARIHAVSYTHLTLPTT